MADAAPHIDLGNRRARHLKGGGVASVHGLDELDQTRRQFHPPPHFEHPVVAQARKRLRKIEQQANCVGPCAQTFSGASAVKAQNTLFDPPSSHKPSLRRNDCPCSSLCNDNVRLEISLLPLCINAMGAQNRQSILQTPCPREPRPSVWSPRRCGSTLAPCHRPPACCKRYRPKGCAPPAARWPTMRMEGRLVQARCRRSSLQVLVSAQPAIPTPRLATPGRST